jgi:hypothetical protein
LNTDWKQISNRTSSLSILTLWSPIAMPSTVHLSENNAFLRLSRILQIHEYDIFRILAAEYR